MERTEKCPISVLEVIIGFRQGPVTSSGYPNHHLYPCGNRRASRAETLILCGFAGLFGRFKQICRGLYLKHPGLVHDYILYYREMWDK